MKISVQNGYLNNRRTFWGLCGTW